MYFFISFVFLILFNYRLQIQMIRKKNNNQNIDQFINSYENKSNLKNQKCNKIVQYEYDQISTPHYSDLSSSSHMECVKNENNNILQFQLSPIKDERIKKAKTKQNNPILKDEDSYLNYLNEDDSILKNQNIMPQDEYRNYAKQLQTDPAFRQVIVYKFYDKSSNRNPVQHNYNNKYYAEYLQWKQNNNTHPQSQTSKIQNIKKQSQNTKSNAQLDIKFQRQLQILNFKCEMQKRNKQKSEVQTKKKLQQIQKQYKQKLQGVLCSKWQRQSFTVQADRARKDLLEQKSKKMGFQHIQYPLIQAVDIGIQYKKLKQREQQKWKQINKQSFVNIIKNPPQKYSQIQINDIPYSGFAPNKTYQKISTYQVPTNIKVESTFGQKIHKQKIKESWKLDVQQILKIPYKQFLLFYNEFQTKIIALATPDELKRLSKYRNQALKRQEALKKLKAKISASGNEIIYKLSQDKRNQLFELLYEDELQQEITRNH